MENESVHSFSIAHYFLVFAAALRGRGLCGPALLLHWVLATGTPLLLLKQLKAGGLRRARKRVVLRVNIGDFLIRVERPLRYFLGRGYYFLDRYIVEAPYFGGEAGH